MSEVPVTQRAYTLRLTGAEPGDSKWRDVLWKTHEAVNKGAKAFGDWLLTLRGGLCHTLVDEPVSLGREKPDRPATSEEQKDRRIVLALSWLSVESEQGTPSKYIIATGRETATDRKKKVIAAYRSILKDRGLDQSQVKQWVYDCQPSLEADIREDAVWINRHSSFRAFVAHVGEPMSPDGAANILFDLLGGKDEYFSMPLLDVTTPTEAKEFAIKAGNWLSTNWGSGVKSNKSAIGQQLRRLTEMDLPTLAGQTPCDVLVAMCSQLETESSSSDTVQTLFKHIKKAIGWKGRPSKGAMAIEKIRDADSQVSLELIDHVLAKLGEEAEEKGDETEREVPMWMPRFRQSIEQQVGIPFRTTIDHTWEYAVILDHALRRVAAGHTWIKRAEAQRGKFEQDARKIGQVPQSVRKWLDSYCEERGASSGSIDGYHIRRRAVEAWNEVVRCWSRNDCKSEVDRIDAARALQDDPEIDKFGDIQLFEALAADEACSVWQGDDGNTNAQPLKDYVLAKVAEHDQRRFKVPAYRHPDPLLHPVFCDFGKSRWTISFAVHESVKKLAKAQQQVEKKTRQLDEKKQTLAKAKTEDRMVKAREKVQQLEIELTKLDAGVKWLNTRRGLTIKLWDGSGINDCFLLWQSKRLTGDLALRETVGPGSENVVSVTRADRLGRAAAGVTSRVNVEIRELFNLKNWNGRLQAPRAQLDEIAAVRDGKKLPRLSDEERVRHVAKLISRLRWLVSFSAKLQPQGPWLDYAEHLPDGWSYNAKRDFVNCEENKSRTRRARLTLCRLPGLRVLSVDLGHRYAAACAVWEAITREQMKQACQETGHPDPAPDDLFLHLKQTTDKRNKEGEPITKTTVYRRIGADKLDGGKPHPAPWARLERQFLIKLQGEEEKPRKATPNEIASVERLETDLGYQRNRPWKCSDKRADQLMSHAVRISRLGLKRHGRRARIAFQLTADAIPAIGGAEEKINTKEKRVSLLLKTLAEWHDLKSDNRWPDDFAKQLWDEYITPLSKDCDLPEPPEEETAQARKKRKDILKEKLEPVAKKLADMDRTELRDRWADHWQKDDGQTAKVEHETNHNGKRIGRTKVIRDATGWHERLRCLQNWLLPCDDKKGNVSLRHVGGLSLTRIATMKSLYQVQKAFFTRLTPDGRQMEQDGNGEPTSTPLTAGIGFGRRVLETMEQLRENRVKQLASRIVEAALGVGKEPPTTGKRRPKRSQQQTHPPCHAVVIENLTHYRPKETRTRRENRQLMIWSSAKVKKYLDESCQLYGLHLREVSAAYTSRQDSRTGMPGARCQDMPVALVVKPSGWLKKRFQRATGNEKSYYDELRSRWDEQAKTWLEVKQDKSGHWIEAQWVLGDDGKWITKDGQELDQKNNPAPCAVRLPQKGGEVFVSANAGSPAAKGLQADLNAAANIGLKALLDPDWEGAWWYVPASLDTNGWRTPKQDVCKGAECLNEFQVSANASGLYVTNGTPLSQADDETVHSADDRKNEAKQAWEAAKKQTKAASKKRGTQIEFQQAIRQELTTKQIYDEAKQALANAKKAAKAKPHVNLWRDVCNAPLPQGEWRGYDAYKNSVQCRVVQVLRAQAGLDGVSLKSTSDSKEDVPF